MERRPKSSRSNSTDHSGRHRPRDVSPEDVSPVTPPTEHTPLRPSRTDTSPGTQKGCTEYWEDCFAGFMRCFGFSYRREATAQDTSASRDTISAQPSSTRHPQSSPDQPSLQGKGRESSPVAPQAGPSEGSLSPSQLFLGSHASQGESPSAEQLFRLHDQTAQRQGGDGIGNKAEWERGKLSSPDDSYKQWEDIYEQEMNKTKIAYQMLAKNIGDEGHNLSKRHELYNYLDEIYNRTTEYMRSIKDTKDIKVWNDFISNDNSYLRGEFKKEMPSQNWDSLLDKQKDKQLHEQDGRWRVNEIQEMRKEAAQQVRKWKDTLWHKLKDLPAFQGFPPGELERLFIDGRYQKEGSNYTLDDEPSFVLGLMRAFDMMLQGLGTEKLTAKYFEQLHDECVRNTYKDVPSSPLHEKRSFELGYRTEISSPGKTLLFGWTDNWSGEGIRELDEKYDCRQGGKKHDPDYGEKGHPVGNVCMDKPSTMFWEKGQYAVCRLTRDDCLETATRIIDQYYKEQEQICKELANKYGKTEWSPDLVKRLSVEEVKELQRPIARLDGNLDQSHLFSDGNIRVIAFIIDRKIELELGLDPSIMYDPNIYDGKSVQEVVDAKYKGQQVFKAIREGRSVEELLNGEEAY